MTVEGEPRTPGETDSTGGPDEPQPILGSWNRLYLLLVLELVVIIAALRLLTHGFD